MKHKHTNNLINETSPYLLQHAHNPVDWNSWDESLLEEARTQNKLLIVSIGYSSCHWCHVMERESFQDAEVANFMNANFINIKVDREERPDVDALYMTAVQMMTGQGGWPLNVIILPDGRPLYGGTYFTKKQWLEVLSQVLDFYKENSNQAEAYAESIANGVQKSNEIIQFSDADTNLKKKIDNSVEKWKQNWDSINGGDRQQVKFMMPSALDLLSYYAVVSKDTQVKQHLKNTLDKIALGGIFDVIGGGFYRYSTDSEWRIPHFEKMLYDNAQLVSTYSNAYKYFKDDLYKQTVEKTLHFLDQVMYDGDGGFYSALDSNSNHEEGAYYIWKQSELQEILENDYKLFDSYYNLSRKWEGYSVFHATKRIDTFAKEAGLNQSTVEAQLTSGLKALGQARQNRNMPMLDDKIITSWNALVITAYVDAFYAFGEIHYLNQAKKTFDYLIKNNIWKGKLLHNKPKKAQYIEAFLEDYAYLIRAAIKLYQATLDDVYLNKADALTDEAIHYFYDDESGLFTLTKERLLFSKLIETDDGVMPSSNAVITENLIKLYHLTDKREYLEKAKRILKNIEQKSIEYPSYYAFWNQILLTQNYPSYEIAVVGENADKIESELLKNYLPNAFVVGSNKPSDLLLFKGRYVKDKTLIYVCQNKMCKLPVETLEDVLKSINIKHN